MARSSHLFCFGFGYCARALARLVRSRGWPVAATARTEEQAGRLKAEGVEPWLFDGTAPLAALRPLEAATHILVSIPPGPGGDPVLEHHRDHLAGLGSVQWIGYLSTTGVYGTRGGGWVDEASDLRPTGERGRRRVEAERGWLALWLDHGAPVHVFRLAGIYGPGRNALAALRTGTAKRVDAPGQVFSRIHVDDVAATLAASIARPRPGAVYNVCDDLPAPPADVVAHAAALLGVDTPPLVPLAEAGLSPLGRSFYDDNKRVRNDLIKRELGVALAYPDYKAGLDALYRAGD